MALMSGERQVAPTIAGIRADHVARYTWAAKMLPAGSHVVDYGCGVGYGAWILAEAGHSVVAGGRDDEALQYARQHYAHPGISFETPEIFWRVREFDAAICFEVVEHLDDPVTLLRDLARFAPRLLVSVPNENVFPHRPEYRFHHRHYRPDEFAALLTDAGYGVESWWGQRGTGSAVEESIAGRTLVAVAGRDAPTTAIPVLRHATPDRPKHIAIVAFGPTSAFYLDAAKKEGNRKRFADFVIAINAMGSIIQSDLVFHMDDVRIQERRAAADPEGHVAGVVEWLREYPGRVMTSRAHPDYPHLEEFPLEDLLNEFQGGYINGTGAAALAYAIYLKPEEISLWGMDFTFPSAHKNERGRACTEYWLGRGQERGILFRLPPKTSLMDSFEDSASDEAHFYGYDTMRVIVSARQDDGGIISFQVTKTPLPESEWPSAAEMEDAYDHGKHPNDQRRKR
jgi:SAM-dependent methyltransferase